MSGSWRIECIRNAADRLKFIKPQEPILVETPPVSDDWLHEIDGFRTQIILDWAGARAFTRAGIDWSKRYWPICRGCREAKGEILHPRRRERKAILWDLIKPAQGIIQYSQHVEGGGAEFFEAAEKMGLEGMVSKRRESSYRSGAKNEAWLKIKCWDIAEFDLIGVKRQAGKWTEGLFARDGKYVGKAVIATTKQSRTGYGNVCSRPAAAQQEGLPSAVVTPDVEWVKPIKASVRTLRGERKLRHASVQNFREES
ncbi:DNA ligase [Mesorhizobium sp. M1050]|uniref:ATP-dependent DNA ligase n=1 Tax=unclassified Mesorhizobium TaxID=325217 RepID=UPI00333791DA